MDDKGMNHFMMVMAIVAVVAIFGIVAFLVTIRMPAGGAYMAPGNDLLLQQAASYPDESSSAYAGLRNCEMVSEQLIKDVAPGTGYGGEHEFFCPYGKIPIRTSIITKKLPGQPSPLNVCDIDVLTSGGYSYVDGGGDVFDGMKSLIKYSNCNQVSNMVFELSMTCCTP